MDKKQFGYADYLPFAVRGDCCDYCPADSSEKTGEIFLWLQLWQLCGFWHLSSKETVTCFSYIYEMV